MAAMTPSEYHLYMQPRKASWKKKRFLKHNIFIFWVQNAKDVELFEAILQPYCHYINYLSAPKRQIKMIKIVA